MGEVVMIGYVDLKKLLISYGIDYTKVVSKNDNVIEFGEYRQIKEVLDYLIGELKIFPKSIEKCPSVLYFNVGAIKENYEFLKNTPITISNINSCLHILCADPIELRKTYEYILNNYGISVLNRQTSILSKNVDDIKKYEYKFKNIMSNDVILSALISKKDMDEIEKIVLVCQKYNIAITGSVFSKKAEEIEKIVLVCQKYNIAISGSVFNKTAEEIEKIILVCQKYNIAITGSVFSKKAEEIEKIVLVCKKYNLEISGSVFNKTAEEIEKIVLVCKKYNLEISGNVFLKTAEEIEKIVLVCQKYNIAITGSVFNKTAEEIEDSCIYIESKYGDVYLKALIVNKNKKHLEKVLPYLEELGVLPIVINSASILTLKLEEIIERKSVLDKLGEPMVKKNKFNSIFGLSRKNYQKKLEELNIKLDDIRGRKV